jgi:hypothetical protein
LDVLALDLDTDVLSETTTQITDELGEGGDCVEEGDVCQGHRLILDIGDRLAELLQLAPPRLTKQLRVGALDGDQRQVGQGVGVQ